MLADPTEVRSVWIYCFAQALVMQKVKFSEYVYTRLLNKMYAELVSTEFRP
jgi:hypothetical protein